MSFIDNIRSKLFPNFAPPCLARVTKVYENAGEGEYCCKCELLRSGDLKKSGQELDRVPFNPIWADRNGAGIYCLPETDSIVIVNFLELNKSFPYIAGIWSHNYQVPEHKAGSFIITDGQGTEIIITESKITIKSGDSSCIEIDNSSFNIGGDKATDYIVKGDTLKTELTKHQIALQTLQKALTTWIPSPQDGGAALQTACKAFTSMQMPDYSSILSTYAKVK